MRKTWKETKEIIRRDVYRNIGYYNKKIVLKESIKRNTPVGLLIHFRVCHYFANKPQKNLLDKLIHGIVYLRFNKCQRICGIELNQRTEIGYGLRIPHRGGIIIHPQVTIGNNCEIMQGVTLGNNILKSRNGVPVIGNEVLICAGAKVIGEITIGDTVVVGANSVVTHNIPSRTVYAGVPAKFIKNCNNDFVINREL